MSKVKKTFEKPGQTMEHDETTADGPAVKIFYETLLQQRPDSAMAAEWLMKRGLLKDDVAKTWLKQLGKDKKGLTASKPALKRKASADDFDSSPARKGTSKAAPAKKQATKKAAAKADSSDDEPFEKKPKPAARKPSAQAKKPPAQAKKPPAPAAKKPPHKKAVAAGDSSDEDERPLSQRTK